MKQKVRRISIRNKILIPSMILVAVICLILGVNAYRHVYSGMMEMGVEEAEMAANVALSAVKGDALTGVSEGFEKAGIYHIMLADMRDIQKTCGIAYLYTLYEKDGQVYYSMDTDETDQQNLPGAVFETSYEELAGVFAGEPHAQDYIDNTEYGDLISVYLPIRNSQGEVVGVLGSDYDAATILNRLERVRTGIIQLGLVCMAAAIALLVLIVNGILRGLKSINGKVYDLVHNEGDLTQKLRVTSGDELELIADNVNALLEHIRGIILEITDNSTQLDSSSRLVADHLTNAKDHVSNVSASVEEMSAAMEETSASLVEINDSMKQIYQTTQEIAGKAESESRTAEKVMQKAQGIYVSAETEQQTVRQRAGAMANALYDRIEKSKAVERINDLTADIIKITDQTSLLSLNASIEAARAGESGRGFAVVAGEIGALAANSAKTAKEINQVSSMVIEAVTELAAEADRMIRFVEQETVAGYDKLLENSQSYQKDMERLNGILREFAEESGRLKENMDRISASVESVRVAVEESAEGITNVAQISVELNQGMEDIESEADGNLGIAGQLQSEVHKFKV